jgi:type IV secretory pathway VirB3-like protein
MTTEPQRTGRNPGLLVAAALSVVLAGLAFVVLDVIVAAFAAAVLLTVAVMAVLASDWDRHSTFEQREHERALRRKATWEANADARERDRRRWEAHQARQAQRAQQAQQTDRPDGDR